jgi:hypothetical protein
MRGLEIPDTILGIPISGPRGAGSCQRLPTSERAGVSGFLGLPAGGADQAAPGEPTSGATNWPAPSAPIVGRSGFVMYVLVPASG